MVVIAGAALDEGDEAAEWFSKVTGIVIYQCGIFSMARSRWVCFCFVLVFNLIRDSGTG